MLNPGEFSGLFRSLAIVAQGSQKGTKRDHKEAQKGFQQI